jgi:hypothetical protein
LSANDVRPPAAQPAVMTKLVLVAINQRQRWKDWQA